MDLSDLTVIEESLAGDEADMPMFALNRARAQFAWKCGGLVTSATGRSTGRA